MKDVDEEFVAARQKEDEKYEAVREAQDTFVGTVNYLSPEVISNQAHTFALDMWALGTIFYKMLFGKVAFAGTNMRKVMDKICSKEIKLSNEAENVSDEAIDLLHKLLDVNPEKRLGRDLESL